MNNNVRISELADGTAVYGIGGQLVGHIATDEVWGKGVALVSGGMCYSTPAVFLTEADGIAARREQLAEMSRRQQVVAARVGRKSTSWHTAPDGTPCCCTAEDRRYGCGCR